MRQTLFYIPHELFGLPVFGFGWLLIVWFVVGAVLIARLVRRHGWSAETRSYLPVALAIGAAIWLVLPLLEEQRFDGVVLGLPIRGYGVMLLLGVTFGVGLAGYQARRMGLDPDVIFSLAFWMFLAGIVGARAFYVLQYWPQFQKDNLLETVQAILSVTSGGLVVYGSLIGGLAAAILFARKRKLPMLAIGDLMAPAMVLGLALGRIGCFLNGCCYGGLAEHHALAVSFPQTSPPYMQQLQYGQLLGLRLAADPQTGELTVRHVEPSSQAAGRGLEAGDKIKSIYAAPVESLRAAHSDPRTFFPAASLETVDGRRFSWSIDELPARSRPVHPTQIYSSINAALLCLLLWAYYPFRRRDGEVFALLLTIYPVTRFLLEAIRSDEPEKFGTTLTISQIGSLLLLLAAAGLWVFLTKQPRGSILPPPQPEAGPSGPS